MILLWPLSDPIFLILEFVDGGTLQDFLKRSRDKHNYKNLHGESQTLTARDLTSFAYQIAKGMAYLSSKKVIHRDLGLRDDICDPPFHQESVQRWLCLRSHHVAPARQARSRRRRNSTPTS